MAVHLPRSCNNREMRTEDLQRQMFQKRNLFSLGGLSLEVNKKEEVKSKAKTTARKSTHVLKTPSPKVASQKTDLPPHKNQASNGLSVNGCFATVVSSEASHPVVHDKSQNVRKTRSVTGTSSISSPLRNKTMTNYLGKKRGRKRKNVNKQLFSLENVNGTDGTTGKADSVSRTIEPNGCHVGKQSLDTNTLTSNVNKWTLSLKETVQGVKGILGLMLKMKFAQSAGKLSENLQAPALNNSKVVNGFSPEETCRSSPNVTDSCIDTSSATDHSLNDSHTQCLQIDCSLEEKTDSHQHPNSNECLLGNKPSSSTALVDCELDNLPDEDSCSMLTSPSTVDSPTVTVASHITSEEAESEEGALQLWLDDSSGDGLSANLSLDKQEAKTQHKALRKKLSTIDLHETPCDDVPPLLCMSDEKLNLEPPRSPEMPILRPATESPKSNSTLSPIGQSLTGSNSKSVNCKLPQVVLEPLSMDLLKKLNSGPVSSTSAEVSKLLGASPPKVNKKPESRRNLFTIFTSRMSKHNKVQVEKDDVELPLCSDKLIIDGIEFYSFETIEALNEYTERELRKKQEWHALYSSDGSDDLSPFNDADFKDVTDSAKYSCSCIKPIIPTKTDDITKIKGWRNKLFAAETTQTASDILPDPEDIKKYHWTKRIELCKHLSHSERKRAGLLTLVKRRRLRLSANKFTKKKIHAKQVKGLVVSDQSAATNAGITEENKISENVIASDYNQMNAQMNDPNKNYSNAVTSQSQLIETKPKRNSVFESEFLDEFLKSRSTLNTQNASSRVSDDIHSAKTEECLHNRTGDVQNMNQEHLPVFPKRSKQPLKVPSGNHSSRIGTDTPNPKKRRGRPKKEDYIYARRTDGIPFKTPYGLYQCFETVFLPVGSSQDSKPSLSVHLTTLHPASLLPSIVTVDDAKRAVSAVPTQYSTSKEAYVDVHKYSLKSGGNFAFDRANGHQYGPASSRNITSIESLAAPKCKELFCRLGCICDSLQVRKRKRGHCGKSSCMFTCVCSEADSTHAETAELSTTIVVRPEIMTDDGPIKRRRATRLPAKLMDSAYVWLQGKELSMDSELNVSLRVGRKSNTFLKPKSKPSPDRPKITNRIRYDYSVSTNRPIAPKIPPIRITNIKAKTSYPIIAPVPPPLPTTVFSKPAEHVMLTSTDLSTAGKQQSATQPMLPLGPSCVNGNMIVDPVVHGYLARALICIAQTSVGGSCLKFIGITAIPQSNEQRDAVVMQLCSSKENSVAFTRIGQQTKQTGETYQLVAEKSSFGSTPNSLTPGMNPLCIVPSPVKVQVDEKAVVCPLGSPQVLFPQILNSVSICKNNFMVTGYLVSKSNLKEAAVRANTTGAVVSVPIRIVRGQFVPFSHSRTAAELEKPVFGAYAIQNLLTHVFIGPFNIALQKRKGVMVQATSSEQGPAAINPYPVIQGLKPLKHGAPIKSSMSTDVGDVNVDNGLSMSQQCRNEISSLAPNVMQVQWNLASEDIECLMSDMIAEVCKDDKKDKSEFESNLTRVVICGNTIRRASTGSFALPAKEVIRRSSVDLIAPGYVSELGKSNNVLILNDGSEDSPSQYESLCKPVKVVLKKLEKLPLPNTLKQITAIPGGVIETVIQSSARPAEKPRLLHPDVARIAWKKSMQKVPDSMEDGKDSSRVASKSKSFVERSRRREQRRYIRRLSVVLDPANTNALKQASKYPSLISLLSQARQSIKELEGHCRNIEEFKKVLINRRLHLFTQYTRLLKELPDAVQKEAVCKLTGRLQACCQVRDKRSKVQTTWEPELDKSSDDFSSENGTAFSDCSHESHSNSTSSSDSDVSDLDVEAVSDADENSSERTMPNSYRYFHSPQDLSNSTSPLHSQEISPQDHINRLQSPMHTPTKNVRSLNTDPELAGEDYSATCALQTNLDSSPSTIHHTLPSPVDAAYYSALNTVLSDHAAYTAKFVQPQSGSVQHIDVVSHSDQCNAFDSQGLYSDCSSNVSDEVMSDSNNCISVNKMYDTANTADRSVICSSPETVEVSDEILEITIPDEDVMELNSTLNDTMDCVQYGNYPNISTPDNCSIQQGVNYDSNSANELDYCATENKCQYDNVYISSTVLAASYKSDAITHSEHESATNNSQQCFDDPVLPTDETFSDDMCHGLPKIIAYSSITEAEFFADESS